MLSDQVTISLGKLSSYDKVCEEIHLEKEEFRSVKSPFRLFIEFHESVSSAVVSDLLGSNISAS